MKICLRCSKEFPEDDPHDNPKKELGKLYFDAIGTINANDLCPECREDLGIVNLLGSDQ